MRDGLKMVNGDCLDVLKDIESESIDCVFSDPPYKYLKGHKLDCEFDEAVFFSECKRVLKKNGFIVLFGRGTSFYRWNSMLAELGFTFKEEIVWNKSYTSSPLMALSRVHETVSVHTYGDGIINKVKVPYLEAKGHDIPAIIQDIKRLKSVLGNTKSLDAVMAFLENQEIDSKAMSNKHSVQIRGNIKDFNRSGKLMRTLEDGMTEKSIIHGSERKHKNSTSVQPSQIINLERSALVAASVTEGMNEKTIINQPREHYTAIHPTQKPVRLLERLLALVTKPGDLVLDPFAGSFSTGIACLNTGRQFIGVEIDSEYYEAGSQRMIEHQPSQEGLFG